MPRPVRQRRIPHGLNEAVFKPLGVPVAQLEEIALTLDGVEALRLADLEGLYHEEAAVRMGVSRATFARVLAQARRCVAEALVHGKALSLGGGCIHRQGQRHLGCPVHAGPHRRGRRCRCGRNRVEPPPEK